ncbi:hypothetical protein [Tenuibacillus multivorans]|uniref:N-acetyltransferase domain-containing protein n=1 Tax=Tenuibacillus multivorans TaxID=237069 RepID=A0A1H0C0M7_9BACI|nr:hypothetical protein [Tenuibacillus multivorans]GEL77720.1 hypothetical protein TMU01_19550 [Tenuibacillus multivorans]SDN51474.1 hypothetical protein SAMN05216498_2463 [Tenuibacillus multivorans]
MSFSKLLEMDTGSQADRQEQLESMEFQIFRMRENMKEISKKYEIVGIDQTKHDHWVIVFKDEGKETAQLMINDCEAAFRGAWDSCLQLQYKNENTIHIDDIKGTEEQGYGSILMNHLKNLAYEKNYQYVTGDLVKRDWDHLNRLEHFYRKHHFDVDIDYDNRVGEIVWNGDSF